jgi:LemA protein
MMLGVIIVIVVFVGLIGMIIYNSLIDKKNQVQYAFGNVDVMFKKRYDLIPNLIDTVKQYVAHERGLLEKLTVLRTEAIQPNLSSEEKVALDNRINSALGQIMVVVESYPDLKASQNFIHLQASLNEVEEQISAARRAYNATVTDYNNGVEMFPSNIVASMMKLKRKKVFEIAVEVERQNVSVNELFWK